MYHIIKNNYKKKTSKLCITIKRELLNKKHVKEEINLIKMIIFIKQLNNAKKKSKYKKNPKEQNLSEQQSAVHNECSSQS